MAASLVQTLCVIFIFGGLIFFHELGHFLAARFFSMGVETFSLGFGPVLWSKKKGKTKYQLAALPFGGFVSLVGETAQKDIPVPFTREESFTLRPAWQRFCVIFAGPLFNIVLAWLLCWGVLYCYGLPTISPEVGSVLADGPAYKAGLKEGDKILQLDDQKISQWMDIPMFMQFNQGAPVSILVQREQSGVIRFTVQPGESSRRTEDGASSSSWILGITSTQAVHTELSFFGAAEAGAVKAKDMLVFTWKAVKGLLGREIPASSMGGPIGIAQVIYQQAGKNFGDLIFLAALISVNLGVLNLLPIPVLDGGTLVFLFIEMITRRTVSEKIQQRAIVVGLTLLLSLMFFATFNDLLRIFQ